ncbi:MAG: ATP-dependent DNA helicase RecG [Ruminococcaceae bacterium]|nr:ATP-dependent DNA helicase RecG [Oscillospiraceae bacterium]
MNETKLSLSSSIDELKGIGKQKKALFDRIGISSVSELLSYLPSSWTDARITSLSEAGTEEDHCFELEVLTNPFSSYVRSGKRMVRFLATDGEQKVNLCFMNQPYVAREYAKGDRILVSARMGIYNNELYLFNPTRLKKLPKGEFFAVYPKTKGLNDSLIRSCIEQAKHLFDDITDPLPRNIIDNRSLLPLSQSLRILHCPDNAEDLQRARFSIDYRQLISLALRATAFEARLKQESSVQMERKDISDFFALLPYRFTPCQSRAFEEIEADVCSKTVTNRLLQGDVGSGKTAVCAACCYTVAKNGYNCAVMAPTEILAKQHFEFFSKIFEKLGVKVVFLSGSSRTAQRREFNSAFDGSAPVIAIGTHALLEPAAKLKNVALCVVDEQQRFGVEQRGKLLSKALCKNCLVMSATPIPRSLAMFLFNKDSISVLDELPPGRTPVSTYLINEGKRDRMLAFIDSEISKGGQVYSVCPLIDDGDDPFEVKSAAMIHELMSEKLLDRRIAMLHGKMSADEKATVMAEFAEGKWDVLVSTTVIEVGVNVPNASVMVIENPERFGLSQLHQLRGRVGRGSRASHCILITPKTTSKDLKRLKFLADNTDGFKIAQYDLENRGPGDFFGTRQSGRMALDLSGDGIDELLEKAKEDALWLHSNKNDSISTIPGEELSVYLN